MKDENKSNDLEDIFEMSIFPYSEVPNLISDLIDKSPDWLQEYGEETQQREFLETQVLIKIYERFEIKLHPEFEGYIIPVESI